MLHLKATVLQKYCQRMYEYTRTLALPHVSPDFGWGGTFRVNAWDDEVCV